MFFIWILPSGCPDLHFFSGFTDTLQKKENEREEILYVVRRARNFSPRKKTACATSAMGSCNSPVQNTSSSKHAGPSMIYQ